MTDPDLATLLARASAPPAAPVDRFVAAIPDLSPARPRPVARWGMLLAAAAAVAVAGGALLVGDIRPFSDGSPGSSGASASLTDVASVYSDDDAFAAVLSGELTLEEMGAETSLTP